MSVLRVNCREQAGTGRKEDIVVNYDSSDEYDTDLVLRSVSVDAIERDTMSQIHSYHTRFMQEVMVRCD